MTCEHCSEEFTPNDKNLTKNLQRFCSTSCRNRFHYEHYHRLVSLGSRFDIPAHFVKEINIQRVCIDLMCRGCRVYRAVNNSDIADLIVIDLDLPTLTILIKIESASVRGDKVYTSKRVSRDNNTLAVCTPDKIIYDPELPESHITSSSVDDVPETSA
jgi:hypothetical protein